MDTACLSVIIVIITQREGRLDRQEDHDVFGLREVTDVNSNLSKNRIRGTSREKEVQYLSIGLRYAGEHGGISFEEQLIHAQRSEKE